MFGLSDQVAFHVETLDDFGRVFYEAVDEYLANCEADGRDPDKVYSGQVMFRLEPSVHREAAIAADREGKSLNAWAEAALHRLAAEQGG